MDKGRKRRTRPRTRRQHHIQPQKNGKSIPRLGREAVANPEIDPRAGKVAKATREIMSRATSHGMGIPRARGGIAKGVRAETGKIDGNGIPMTADAGLGTINITADADHHGGMPIGIAQETVLGALTEIRARAGNVTTMATGMATTVGTGPVGGTAGQAMAKAKARTTPVGEVAPERPHEGLNRVVETSQG